MVGSHRIQARKEQIPAQWMQSRLLIGLLPHPTPSPSQPPGGDREGDKKKKSKLRGAPLDPPTKGRQFRTENRFTALWDEDMDVSTPGAVLSPLPVSGASSVHSTPSASPSKR
ncbi:hypothetical protein BaRGS_00011176 [Batillaria attramentaria]|uniref:Uncharacterized protein n=1 Tax=Batillaria attramentaria TaxID=370345 RepID=A0ABD0LEE3_9CAEN